MNKCVRLIILNLLKHTAPEFIQVYALFPSGIRRTPHLLLILNYCKNYIAEFINRHYVDFSADMLTEKKMNGLCSIYMYIIFLQ